MSEIEKSVPKKKFGVITAIAMVVGTVIGSGVFKCAGSVIAATGGSVPKAIAAWLIGGIIITISTYAFAIAAKKNAKGSGIIDFIENLVGPKISYLVAWFLNFVYFPTLIAVIAYLAGSISNTIIGSSVDLTWYLAFFYFVATYVLDIFAPKIAAKWQVTTTAVKLVPLILIALVGLIYGLINGTTVTSFTEVATNVTSDTTTGIAAAVAITAFAYDGWIAALGISEELKDPQKNLSRALIGGAIIIVVVYILFFIGLSGVVTNDEAVSLAGKLDTSVLAANRLFGSVFGSIISVLILVSVLGTLNGLTIGGVHGMHQICSKGHGPKQELFTKIGKNDAPIASGLISFIFTFLWGIVWFGDIEGWWETMDISVLPIVFLYGSFIFVYVDIIKNFNELNIVKRYIVPVIATAGAIYMIYGAASQSWQMFFIFCVIVFVLLFVGYLLYSPFKSNKSESIEKKA